MSLLSLCRLVSHGENLKNYDTSIFEWFETTDIWNWTIHVGNCILLFHIDGYHVGVLDMNGHLTFLEWTVILATTIYILWRTCL